MTIICLPFILSTLSLACIVQVSVGCACLQAVDQSVRLMLRGEIAAVKSTWRYSYQGRDDAPAGVSPDSDLEFELELVDFESEPNWTTLDAEQKLQRAQKWREQGNTIYKQVRAWQSRTDAVLQAADSGSWSL